MDSNGCCSGRLLLILLAIAFFPITILVFIWKSDIGAKAKLIITGILGIGCLIGYRYLPEDTREQIRLPNRETPLFSQSESVNEDSNQAVSTTTRRSYTFTTTKRTTTTRTTTTTAQTTKTTESKTSTTRTTTTKFIFTTTKRVTTRTTTTTAATTRATTAATTKTTTTKATVVAKAAPGGYYILNTDTGVVHSPNCRDVAKMNDENKQEYYGSIIDLSGYRPCGHCHPY